MLFPQEIVLNLTAPRLRKRFEFANSVDPDVAAHNEPSQLDDLHYLPSSTFITNMI